MLEFKRLLNGFNYIFEKVLVPDEEVVVKMPVVSANKRGINDIGWQTDGDNVVLYGTLSRRPKDANALWQEIEAYNDVNKTVSALKIINKGDKECQIIIRAILN